MMTFTFYLYILLNIMFLLATTPLMLATLIILIVCMVAIFTYSLTTTSWLSFIFFMLFISAMMIIFIYVASLASNEFITTSMPLPFVFIFLFSFLFLNPSTLLEDLTFFSVSTSITDATLTPNLMMKIYTPYISILSMFMIIYLFVALVVVAKNSSISKSPMRSYK
uniref:ND6 n=1 Tax=Pandorites podoceroides TaxID=1842081 RepID=A0A9N7AAQ8_9CRUS|nr:TPA_asm: ND6 [Pandorites podoceroides]